MKGNKDEIVPLIKQEICQPSKEAEELLFSRRGNAPYMIEYANQCQIKLNFNALAIIQQLERKPL